MQVMYVPSPACKLLQSGEGCTSDTLVLEGECK